MPLSLNKSPQQWNKRPEVLLSPNIPKPMHGVAPRIALGQVWWDSVRIDAYRSTSYHCIACGVFKRNSYGVQRLQGHEMYEIDYLLGRMFYVETVPLCTLCHEFIHDGRLEAMRQKGEITDEHFQEVTTHGKSILRKAKLKKPEPYNGPMADWADWRMVVNGLEFGPKFRSYEDWALNFGAVL